MLTEANKVFIVVLTKADKVKATELEDKAKIVVEYIKRAGSLCVPVVHCVSALQTYGMFELKSNLLFHLKQDLVVMPSDTKNIF